jgi:hypothetical protein
MDQEKRSLNHIKDDIKVITTNKLSTSQSKLLFMGIIYEIILRKDLFPKNSDLKSFIDKIFVKRFASKEPLRDYLYFSRTLLAARIQSKIQLDLEYNQIIEMVNEIYNVLPVEDSKKVFNLKNVNSNTELGNWMNFIREKDSKK